MSQITKNRIFYSVLFLVVLFLTAAYGGYMLIASLLLLLFIPAVSLLLALITVYTLEIKQSVKRGIMVKGEEGTCVVTIKNKTPFVCEHVKCFFVGDDFAVTLLSGRNAAVRLASFEQELIEQAFCVNYRGEYNLGLRRIEISDMLGLFKLKRRFGRTASVAVYPVIIDITYFPLAMNLLTHTHSNYEIKEEDYSQVTDVRPYEPSDSIKKIHWKLTAQMYGRSGGAVNGNDWNGNFLVKNFQSNALNSIVILVDASKQRPYISKEQSLIMEDRIIESCVGIMQYCLRMRMPVELTYEEKGKTFKNRARNLNDFEKLYVIAAGIRFENPPDNTRIYPILNEYLNDTSFYINAVILTASIDDALYERIIRANHYGHFISVLYFTGRRIDHDSERLYKLLLDRGTAAYRITENSGLTD